MYQNQNKSSKQATTHTAVFHRGDQQEARWGHKYKTGSLTPFNHPPDGPFAAERNLTMRVKRIDT